MNCEWTFISQIIAIVGGIFAIIVGCFNIKDANGNIQIGCNGFFNILFGLLIILTEVYRPEFFKYFGFLVCYWGKIIIFAILVIRTITIDFRNFTVAGVGWIIDLICIIVFVLYTIILGGGTKALLQKDGVDMGVSASDLFKLRDDY